MSGLARVMLSEVKSLMTAYPCVLGCGGAHGLKSLKILDFQAKISRINVGSAAFVELSGNTASINVSNVSFFIENFISITGQQITVSTANVVNRADQILDMTGQELTISQATIIPNSNNFLSITGNQANVDVATLKFWDPIKPTITEEWTNIH